MDTIGDLLQWARSAISSRWSIIERKRHHSELFCLECGLRYLMDTLPDLYALIDRAEWRSHISPVDKLLPNLKDAVYDADDLLDEFRWYMLNVKVGGIGSQSIFMDFLNNIIEGNFTESVKGIRGRLDNLSTRLQKVGLDEVNTRFDKSVRPETSLFPSEEDFIGRDMEIRKIIEFLCKPRNSSRSNPKRHKGNSAVDVSSSTPSSNQVSSKSDMKLTVLPIVGIGGVGKTTLAQHICSNDKVKSEFKLIIWVCVSDEFDVKRLTKEAIESCPGQLATTDNLGSFQRVLSEIASSTKFLIVLDDMWDDVWKDNGESWKSFCAPLKNVQHGSVVLVTTRCQKVADRVGTMDPITLEGLKDDDFWNFFRLCVFGSRNSNNNDPKLECIGRSIVDKLKGSPLAAKTLGRILRMNLQAEYWNTILKSELWMLKQEDTEILPALRLSYMYLPFHLKRCFALCALYPKDYKFKRDYLAEIWVAEGFVEPQGDIPVRDIGCQYFDELFYRSFFQIVQGEYVIHDLLHDMAQKVSEFECFIVKRKSDFENIPANIRHLTILSDKDIRKSDLLAIRKLTKLRTILCNQPLANKKISPSLMEIWFNEIIRLRVVVFATTLELPANIGNLKHLRYFEISKACRLKSLPTKFCWLYNLQILSVKKCKLESLPTDFSKLIFLQRFESHGFLCESVVRRSRREELYHKVSVDASKDEKGLGFQLIKNINQLSELVIYNIGKPIEKDHAIEAQLENKKYLEKINLKWLMMRNPEDNDTELIRFLQPPTCLKSLLLHVYPGVSLPSWFGSANLPTLMSPSSMSCDGLTDLIIDGCENLSSLEQVIYPGSIPALRKLTIKNCKNLLSVPAENFGYFCCLEELVVQGCPSINSQGLVAPSLKKLVLGEGYGRNNTCGNLAGNIMDCCSLTYFFLACEYITSIHLQKWNLPALEVLIIHHCYYLESIISCTGSGRAFPSVTSLTIIWCENLSTVDDLLTEECLPVIEDIHIKHCRELRSLPGERFVSFSSLKELDIFYCVKLSSKGFVLPSSLQILSLHECGDISAWVPSCLQNLASLVALRITNCRCITSIPGNLWSTNLTSLEKLYISNCCNIVSIGGENAISEIKNVTIQYCSKMEEIKQPMIRGLSRW